MAKEIAFAELIRKHQGLLFKVTSIYTDNSADREDLFQEVVYQLWKSYDSFRNESKISTWMYRVAMNTAISQLKKRKRRPNAVPISDTILSYSENQDGNFEERIRMLYIHI